MGLEEGACRRVLEDIKDEVTRMELLDHNTIIG